MPIKTILQVIWARKWLILGLALLVATAGSVAVKLQPKQYTAESTMVVEMRIDPVMGAIAPGLAQPGYMATQIEIIKSERVGSRAVKILGIERSPAALAEWRESTSEKVPVERFFASMLQRGLNVEALRGSSLIEVTYTAGDPKFAQAAANAFVQAYLDVSVELRVAPARQSAEFLDEQIRVLRSNLEAAQAKLTKFQQEKGIVVSDERYDQENMRFTTLTNQLALAQTELVETAARRRNTGSEVSPDVLASGAVGGLKAQLGAAQTKLTEISAIVGKNHPSRVQLEAQIDELQKQLAAEIRRVSSSTSTVNKGSAEKVAELKAMFDQQKKLVLSMRNDRDQISVYLRDVETAQRAYDAVTSRVGQFNLESQNNQANTRLLSPAVEPLWPSKPKVRTGILASIFGGLILGLAAAFGWEFLDRRVRGADDIKDVVPVLGVLRSASSRRRMPRRLLLAGPSRPATPLLGGPAGSV